MSKFFKSLSEFIRRLFYLTALLVTVPIFIFPDLGGEDFTPFKIIVKDNLFAIAASSIALILVTTYLLESFVDKTERIFIDGDEKRKAFYDANKSLIDDIEHKHRQDKAHLQKELKNAKNKIIALEKQLEKEQNPK